MPLDARRSPNSTPSSTSIPDPAIPARPTISPGRASKLTSTRPVPTLRCSTTSEGPSRSATAPRAREQFLLLGSDHRLDHLGDGQPGRVAGQDLAPVAHHRHSVGDLEDLLEPVRDVEHGDPGTGQLAQDREQPTRLPVVERRVGLVEDEHTRLFEQHPGELDELALGDRHLSDGHRRVDVDTQTGEHGTGATLHLSGRDEAEARRLAVDEQVGQQRTIREDAELLVDDADAVPARRVCRPQLDGLAVQRDRAGVGSHGAGEGLHQRRLAGAVLTDDGVDRPRGDLEVDAADGDDAAVRLAQPGDVDRDHGASTGVGSHDRLPTPNVGHSDSASMGSTDDCQSAITPSTSGW